MILTAAHALQYHFPYSHLVCNYTNPKAFCSGRQQSLQLSGGKPRKGTHSAFKNLAIFNGADALSLYPIQPKQIAISICVHKDSCIHCDVAHGNESGFSDERLLPKRAPLCALNPHFTRMLFLTDAYITQKCIDANNSFSPQSKKSAKHLF